MGGGSRFVDRAESPEDSEWRKFGGKQSSESAGLEQIQVDKMRCEVDAATPSTDAI